MGVFGIVKSLEKEEDYVKFNDEKCPECNGQIYIEFSNEECEAVKAEVIGSGGEFNLEMVPRRRFCWQCEYKNLSALREYVNEMESSKVEALERMKIGAFQQNEAQMMMGLHQLCQVFGGFMELFDFHIMLPDDGEDKAEEESEEKESLIIAP